MYKTTIITEKLKQGKKSPANDANAKIHKKKKYRYVRLQQINVHDEV